MLFIDFIQSLYSKLAFTSFLFFCLLALTFALYFLVPFKARKFVLLVASIGFYATWGIAQFVFVTVAAVTAWGGALAVSAVQTRQAKRALLWLSIAILIIMLVYVKIGKIFLDAKSLVIPLGISYYTFSVIGYLADVYRGKEKAERNILHFLLYMLYFPHILQGPIPRHERLAPQLIEGHAFDYKAFCFGIQRAIWGLFKKLVIADRFSVITSTVFGPDFMNYSGQVYVFALLCSVFVMYCDFSGCMDIAIGVSESFGIKLDENFRRPFYSRTAGEFWRRWHITLGTWFTDYIFMPFMTPTFVKFCGKTKKIFGKKFSKSIMMVIPLGVVWLLTGLWHGTGKHFIVWGAYWWIIVSIENVFEPEFKKIRKKLKIQQDSPWFARFQIFRTFIFFIGSRGISGLGGIGISKHVLKSILTEWNPWIWFDKTVYSLGLDAPNLWAGIVAIFILWKMSSLQEHGVHILEKIAEFPLPVRWAVYLGGIFSVLIFGWYGPGFDASNFIYMQF